MIYLQLLWVYLKIGTFGFGGGYAMLSLIQHEIVDLHHWLTPQQFTDVVAISQMTPGPIGINSATYVGYAVTHSVWGAVLATVAVCLPSFILVLLISYFFAKCKDNKYIKAAMSGLLPMSVALIASAALLMMNRENFIEMGFASYSADLSGRSGGGDLVLKKTFYKARVGYWIVKKLLNMHELEIEKAR